MSASGGVRRWPACVVGAHASGSSDAGSSDAGWSDAGRSDAGSGTVLVLALVAVVLVLAGALGLLTGAQSARGRAQTAADLAALAAAEVISAPRGLVLAPEALAAARPCELAGDVVGRNGGRMTTCRVIGGRVVEVGAAVPMPGLGPATAVARAGPASLR